MTGTAAVSKRTSKIVGVFAFIVLAGVILAMKFAVHPVAWILALFVSVPVFAAIVGYLPEKSESD